MVVSTSKNLIPIQLLTAQLLQNKKVQHFVLFLIIVLYSQYKDYITINHMIIGYSHSAMLYHFLSIFCCHFNHHSSCFQEQEKDQQPGGLSRPRKNHAIVTSRSKHHTPNRSTGSVEQIFHSQFFFTTKSNLKNRTNSK